MIGRKSGVPVVVVSLAWFLLLDHRRVVVVDGLLSYQQQCKTTPRTSAQRRLFPARRRDRFQTSILEPPPSSFTLVWSGVTQRVFPTTTTTTTATSRLLLLQSRSSGGESDNKNNNVPNSTTRNSNDGVHNHNHQPPHLLQLWRRDPRRAAAFSVIMTLSGAVLGPFLDSFHSAFGVLQYNVPWTTQLWGTAEHPALSTAWWVPELFGLAGFLIGWLYILLDHYWNTNTDAAAQSPSPPKILLGISLFTLQYWLSGALVAVGVDRTTMGIVLSVVAASGWAFLDGTGTGFVVSAMTALGGPLIEIVLLTMSRNDLFPGGTGYQYLDLGEAGFFPLWIVPVYFLGGPANGNLARGYWTWLGRILRSGASLKQDDACTTHPDTAQLPGCRVCTDTRRVPCPNCDGIGTYAAMGGQTVTCKACRGRGYVICRACFSY